MKYGVSYYPEHKTDGDLNVDLNLLKQSGINTVRMGEFAWSRMEPKEGVYTFQWLVDIVNDLGESGIDTILCTPTACPPAWLVEKYPDILYQDNRRIVRPFGGRRHYCYTNPTYRDYSQKITEMLSLAFKDNPYVIGVQIDNEPAQEGTGRCTCSKCTQGFHQWLKKRFGTIDDFNTRSGAVFWSQEYTCFEQVSVPVTTIEVGATPWIHSYFENPTVRLMFEEYASDQQIEYQNIQRNILKKYFKEGVHITTNGTGLATNSIDYYKSFKDLDRYAFDYYPEFRNARVSSLPYTFGRGIKNETPFWVLEFMSGGGHRLGGSGRLQPNPGALKQAVLQSFAFGAEMMMHFQYRTFPFGAEQLNYAIVDMDGVPRRRYYEMQETAELLKKLEPLERASFENAVALCFDYKSHWALRMKPVNDPIFNYIDYMERLYKVWSDIGMSSDVIFLDGPLEKYKVIVLPATIVLSQEHQKKLGQYVERGGTLVATFLTSVKNEDNVGYTESLPAGLQHVFGVCVEEVEPVFERNQNQVQLYLENIESVDKSVLSRDQSWSELLGGHSKAIGCYTEGYKVNQKVISSHRYGKGMAYYIGTDLEESAYEALFKHIGMTAGIQPLEIKRDKNVEAIRRHHNGQEIVFLFNFTNEKTIVEFKGSYTDYVTKEVYQEKAIMERNGTLIVYRE